MIRDDIREHRIEKLIKNVIQFVLIFKKNK